ncbi:hypothetical protein FRC11_003856, partial [Ceratobasidium sp. 423]
SLLLPLSLRPSGSELIIPGLPFPMMQRNTSEFWPRSRHSKQLLMRPNLSLQHSRHQS